MEEDVYTRAVWAILEEMEYDQFRPELVDILKRFFPDAEQAEDSHTDHWEDDVHLL